MHAGHDAVTPVPETGAVIEMRRGPVACAVVRIAGGFPPAGD